MAGTLSVFGVYAWGARRKAKHHGYFQSITVWIAPFSAILYFELFVTHERRQGVEIRIKRIKKSMQKRNILRYFD